MEHTNYGVADIDDEEQFLSSEESYIQAQRFAEEAKVAADVRKEQKMEPQTHRAPALRQ